MLERLKWFKEPGYQQTQAMIALGKGGLFGAGLGAGYQKLGYLPAGHTDFIFANVGEELGLLGTLSIGILYAVLLIHGVRVALAAEQRRDAFGFHLAAGISLPFLSQGGSNLMVSLLAVGLIVGVARHAREKA